MKQLKKSLRKFCDVFGRSNFDLGSVRFADEELDVKLPPIVSASKALGFLYRHVDFSKHLIIGGDLNLQIESVQKIEGAQHGWRWIFDEERNLQQNTRWPESWTVIGNRNGDALIVDVLAEGSPVYGAIQSDYFRICDSFESFFSVLVAWMECEHQEFHMETEDDDFNPKPEYIARLREIAGKSLSSDEVDGCLKYFFE